MKLLITKDFNFNWNLINFFNLSLLWIVILQKFFRIYAYNYLKFVHTKVGSRRKLKLDLVVKTLVGPFTNYQAHAPNKKLCLYFTHKIDLLGMPKYPRNFGVVILKSNSSYHFVYCRWRRFIQFTKVCQGFVNDLLYRSLWHFGCTLSFNSSKMIDGFDKNYSQET